MIRYFAVAAIGLGLLALVASSLLFHAPPAADSRQFDDWTLLPAATAADAKDGWGSVKGVVVWAGPASERKPIAVDTDKDHCMSKGPVLSEELVVNPKNKGVQWTLVWLAPEPGTDKKTLAIHPDLQKIKNQKVEIDQPICAFVPHVLAMRAGQDLVVKNSAPVAHNVNWAGHPLQNPGGNVIVPAKGEYTIAGLKPDRFPIRVACNIHKWMSAKVGVYDHPYFAVTDENGAFEIKQAPAGDCRLMVWQESVGWRGGAAGKNGEKITIKGGAATDVGKLELKPSE